MKDIVPRPPSQLALLKAMDLIWDSQQRQLFKGYNIPAHIRNRFFITAKLVKDEDPCVGWQGADGSALKYSRAGLEKLEDEVIEDILPKRDAA